MAFGVLSDSEIRSLQDPFGRFSGDIRPNQPYILDLETLQRLFFQSIPQEIEVSGDAQLATVGTMGRNNPYYHYTGAEDEVKFTISWFAMEDDLRDVLQKCKWLKALSRKDGDAGTIHRIQFSMGEMFKESKWVMSSASYTLRHFIRANGMLPCLATTNIVLKKITEQNETHAQMIKIGT